MIVRLQMQYKSIGRVWINEYFRDDYEQQQRATRELPSKRATKKQRVVQKVSKEEILFL